MDWISVSHSPERCGQALRADARGVSSPQSNGLTIPGAFHLVFQNSSGTQRGFYCATLPRTHLGRQHRLPSRCPSTFSARRVVSMQQQKAPATSLLGKSRVIPWNTS